MSIAGHTTAWKTVLSLPIKWTSLVSPSCQYSRQRSGSPTFSAHSIVEET
nr:hypothetical protein [Rubrobacter marinus]